MWSDIRYWSDQILTKYSLEQSNQTSGLTVYHLKLQIDHMKKNVTVKYFLEVIRIGIWIR